MMDNAARGVPPQYCWMVKGTPCFYHSVIGEPPTRETAIRDEPWLLSGHSWVTMVEGVAGCVACEAVTPRQAEQAPAGGLGLAELIRLVGDEHALIEPVADNLQGAQLRKGGLTELRLLTSQTNPNEIARGGPDKVGLLIWMPRERVDHALAEWRRKQTTARESGLTQGETMDDESTETTLDPGAELAEQEAAGEQQSESVPPAETHGDCA